MRYFYFSVVSVSTYLFYNFKINYVGGNNVSFSNICIILSGGFCVFASNFEILPAVRHLLQSKNADGN